MQPSLHTSSRSDNSQTSAAMAAVDDSLVRFKQLLTKECRIDERVVKYITETMTLTSVSDFAGTFTQINHSDSCKTEITDKIEDVKADLAQLSRVRNAWEMCRAELDASLKRKSSNSAVELDEPLDDIMRTEINANFEKLYSFKIPDELTPSATLMGRLYRELKNGTISVHDLTKVKTAIVNDAIIPKKRKVFGDIMMTMKGEEDDIRSSIGSAPSHPGLDHSSEWIRPVRHGTGRLQEDRSYQGEERCVRRPPALPRLREPTGQKSPWPAEQDHTLAAGQRHEDAQRSQISRRRRLPTGRSPHRRHGEEDGHSVGSRWNCGRPQLLATRRSVSELRP